MLLGEIIAVGGAVVPISSIDLRRGAVQQDSVAVANNYPEGIPMHRYMEGGSLIAHS